MGASVSQIICLMGPTASGKTQLAIDLVQQFPLDIISVDSAMVYRGMDIGTAKPTSDILRLAPHRLLDICDPRERYSVAQFCEDAWREIHDILAHGKIPLLVGGTMLYFHALQQGLAELPSADVSVRESLLHEGSTLGWPHLHERLVKIDPVAAKRIHPHDMQRIQRALEVYELTGKNMTESQEQHQVFSTNHHFINLAIMPDDRALLHQAIAERFDDMLKKGFIDEVKKLYDRGDLSLELPSMRSVGYRQVWQYLEGTFTFDEMREKSIIATRQLAKRQLTWLRSWENAIYFSSDVELKNYF